MLGDLAEKHPESDWLRRSVLAHQALIEEERGHTDAALRLYRDAQRINLAIKDYPEFVVNQLCIAEALRGAGRNEEALEELDRGMNTAMEKGDYSSASLALLRRYATTIKAGGGNPSITYAPLLLSYCERLGVPVERPILNGDDFSQEVERAYNLYKHQEMARVHKRNRS
jgi:tetratricopeptide (TPR) repeat protein